MKKILFSMGVVALALSSCSQEDVVNVNTSNGPDPISFRVRSSRISRAAELTTFNLDDFMVYGYKGDAYEEDVIPYFENGDAVKFTRVANDVVFTSATPYYFPVDGSWLTFTAYAPSSLEMTAFGKHAGVKYDNFTVDTDITKQLDIIFADGGSNLEPDEPDLELSFVHALTKVFVSEVSNSDSRYKYEIMGVKFGNVNNSGDVEFLGEKWAERGEDEVNEVFDENGYIANGDGKIFWKPTGEQTAEFEYIFDEAVVLDKDTERATLMSGNEGDADLNGAFMFVPQQLCNGLLNEEGTINSSKFEAGQSYVALLVRITYLPTNEVIYPYAEGVEAISKTIGEGEDAETYAWAAFPISTLWVPGHYADYFVDFSKGAGYVAPGATEHEFEPIFGREIRFTEEVLGWNSGIWVTVDQENQLGMDVTDADDAFGDDND